MDRVWWCGVLACVAFLVPAPAAGQASTAAPVVFVGDKEGDVYVENPLGGSAPLPQGAAHVDILGIWISNETADEFELGMRLRQWQDPLADNAFSARRIQIGFRVANVTYFVLYAPQNIGLSCLPQQAILGTAEDENMAPWVPGKCVNISIEAGSGMFHARVPKQYVANGLGGALQAGDEVPGLFAYARSGQFVRDRAPDSGFGASFALRQGALPQQGDLFLTPLQPVRASNGEATTMVFPVRLTNRGPAPDAVALSIRDSQSEWTLRVPARANVAAAESVTVPVILSMNFTHEHGVTRYFVLRADSLRNPGDFAETRMGVNWLEIPQPAGHHDRLWLHSMPVDAYGLVPFTSVPSSATGWKVAWINALEADPNPNAKDEPIGGQPASFGTALGADSTTRTAWSLPLEPKLQIGLDLDTERAGSIATKVRSTLSASRATLAADVWYCDPAATFAGPRSYSCGRGAEPGTHVTLLSGTSGPRTLAANGETPFEVELRPNESADLLPYKAGGNLFLRLVLETDTPQNAYAYGGQPVAQLVVKGSLLTMPLMEYHDPVDQAFQDVGTLRLNPLDPYEKKLNPGRGAVFRFDATNVGPTSQRLRVGIEGVNAEWASIHGGQDLELPSSENRQVTLIVRAPDDAEAGERAELFLVLESVDDPNVVSLARVRAAVVSEDEALIPDEAASLSPDVVSPQSPGLGALAVSIITLAVVILVRGRRQERRF